MSITDSSSLSECAECAQWGPHFNSTRFQKFELFLKIVFLLPLHTI